MFCTSSQMHIILHRLQHPSRNPHHHSLYPGCHHHRCYLSHHQIPLVVQVLVWRIHFHMRVQVLLQWPHLCLIGQAHHLNVAESWSLVLCHQLYHEHINVPPRGRNGIATAYHGRRNC